MFVLEYMCTAVMELKLSTSYVRPQWLYEVLQTAFCSCVFHYYAKCNSATCVCSRPCEQQRFGNCVTYVLVLENRTYFYYISSQEAPNTSINRTVLETKCVWNTFLVYNDVCAFIMFGHVLCLFCYVCVYVYGYSGL